MMAGGDKGTERSDKESPLALPTTWHSKLLPTRCLTLRTWAMACPAPSPRMWNDGALCDAPFGSRRMAESGPNPPDGRISLADATGGIAVVVRHIVEFVLINRLPQLGMRDGIGDIVSRPNWPGPTACGRSTFASECGCVQSRHQCPGLSHLAASKVVDNQARGAQLAHNALLDVPIVRPLVSSAEPIHHLALGVGQHTRETYLSPCLRSLKFSAIVWSTGDNQELAP